MSLCLTCQKVWTTMRLKSKQIPPLLKSNWLLMLLNEFKYIPLGLMKILTGASFVPAEEERWRRVQLITSCHNLWDWTQSSQDCCQRKSWPAQSGLTFRIHLIDVVFHRHFSSLRWFTYLSELIVVGHPLILYFLLTSCKRMSRTVQRVTLAGEKYAEGRTLIWKCGHKFLPLPLSLTHCHIPLSLLSLQPLTVAQSSIL